MGKVNQSVSNFTPRQLLDALFVIWDAFDRANVPMFLVGDTFDKATKNKDLVGGRVTVGIKRTEWDSGGKRIIDAFITPTTETKDVATYHFGGVPVELHIYKDSECVRNLDSIHYRYEAFKIPNPYSEFESLYGNP